MKIDAHTHVREGSADSIVSISKTIEILKEKGYEGMIVTDHNSYQGYKASKNQDDFVVIKGIEYDTRDAGHMLIILPTKVDVDIFTNKGMTIKDTVKIVHSLGGIIGPAHPFDYSKLGMLNNAKWMKNVNIIKHFDFIEGFNACGSLLGNKKSHLLAQTFNKPVFGGSDSHKVASVGKAFTLLPERINNEDELISLTKSMSYGETYASGEYYLDAMHNKLGVVYNMGLTLFIGFGKLSSHMSAKRALSEAISLSLI